MAGLPSRKKSKYGTLEDTPFQFGLSEVISEVISEVDHPVEDPTLTFFAEACEAANRDVTAPT